MRKKNYKGRCEKKKIDKCNGIFKSFDALQIAYAELLVKRNDISEIRCNVAIGDTEYMTDIVAVKDDGELLVRECINRKYLTGFKESKIWGMLYNFQRDAALAIINKLEKYNGCILADSVGLGKSFTALSVIKYYENRNKSVLVLCPKKLANNWNTFKDNYVNNPIAADRMRYDVLFHTDLSRTTGTSNGLDLDRLNWGKYFPYSSHPFCSKNG